MIRRTYQQAQTWRAAAVALLAEVGVELPRMVDPTAEVILFGRAVLTIYLTGSVSIGGPGPDADYLCEPLERHGLLNGWHPGSRGSGVVWVPQLEVPRQPSHKPLEVRWAGPGEGVGNLGLGVVVSGWEGRTAQDLMEAFLALPSRLTTDAGSGRVKP